MEKSGQKNRKTCHCQQSKRKIKQRPAEPTPEARATTDFSIFRPKRERGLTDKTPTTHNCSSFYKAGKTRSTEDAGTATQRCVPHSMAWHGMGGLTARESPPPFGARNQRRVRRQQGGRNFIISQYPRLAVHHQHLSVLIRRARMNACTLLLPPRAT